MRNTSFFSNQTFHNQPRTCCFFHLNIDMGMNNYLCIAWMRVQKCNYYLMIMNSFLSKYTCYLCFRNTMHQVDTQLRTFCSRKTLSCTPVYTFPTGYSTYMNWYITFMLNHQQCSNTCSYRTNRYRTFIAMLSLKFLAYKIASEDKN